MLLKKSQRNIIRICNLFFLFALVFLSCKQPETSHPPVNKTYIEFDNVSEFDVNVFKGVRPVQGNKPSFDTIPAGKKKEFVTEPTNTAINPNGDIFYFQYIISLGSVKIPFPTTKDTVFKIKKNNPNTLVIPGLSSTDTTSSYLIVENESSESISVLNGSQPLFPYDQPSEEYISVGKTGVYELINVTNLANFEIGNISSRRKFQDNFNNNGSIKPGRIYAFKYDASSVYLYSESHFDISARRKIWTIPTYNEPVPKGRFFTTGLFSSRANAERDGYILTGSVHYERGTVTSPHVGAIPYIGMVSVEGGITRERSINLIAKPAGFNLQSFIEDSNELIYVGQVYYEDIVGRPCILSTDNTVGIENSFYEKFIDDMDFNQELHGQKLVKWNTNTYAVGCQIWDDNKQKARIYIAKATKVKWDEFTHEVFWISPENNYATLVDLIFDQSHNMVIVLADTGIGSAVYFINAADGTLIHDKPVKLDDYWINGLFSVGQEYYVAGGLKGVSIYRGFVTKIDVVNGSVDILNPLRIDPAKYELGAGSFRYILPEVDGTLILAGWCVANRGNAESSSYYMPWLVKYDLTNGIIWEQIYENYIGYYINSVHHNAIGSYLLEIHNDKTYHSYLVSTDLLGKMSGTRLAPLPRDSNIKASEPGRPGITVVITINDAELLTPTALDIKKGDSRIIEVQGTWLSYQWYVNGSLSGTGSSYTFSTSDRNLGVYNVTAVVTDSADEKRSASCRVTVTN